MFIVLTLNYMGHILKNYNDISNNLESQKDTNFSTMTKFDGDNNKEVNLKSQILNNNSLSEVKLSEIFESESKNTNQKRNRPKPSYDIHYTKFKSNYIFPVNEHFDKLSPFKIYDEQNEQQTYIKFSSSN